MCVVDDATTVYFTTRHKVPGRSVLEYHTVSTGEEDSVPQQPAQHLLGLCVPEVLKIVLSIAFTLGFPPELMEDSTAEDITHLGHAAWIVKDGADLKASFL